jgi:hypothetical protein
MGHYQPSDASYTIHHKHAKLDCESSLRHNDFEFTFTVESKINPYQPPKHESDVLKAPEISWQDDTENPFDLARSRPSSPVPWAFGDDDDASTQDIDPLLLHLEDESLVMIRMDCCDDSDHDSFRDPFESEPLVLQPHNSDTAIDFAQKMLEEEEEERREDEKKNRKRAQLEYVMGSPRRARRYSEEQIQMKGSNASLRRKVLLRNAMMEECVRREGYPLALTPTLREASGEAGWDDDDEARVEQ